MQHRKCLLPFLPLCVKLLRLFAAWQLLLHISPHTGQVVKLWPTLSKLAATINWQNLISRYIFLTVSTISPQLTVCARAMGRGLFQTLEDHPENHPTLNPPRCSRTSLACHSQQYEYIYYSSQAREFHTAFFYFCYIKSSMNNIRIKGSKMVDCHHLHLWWTDWREIQCPCWKCPRISTSSKSNGNHFKHLGLQGQDFYK